MGKLSVTILLFIIFPSIDYALVCSHGKSTTSSGCVAEERKALLKFKGSLSDPYNILSSWNESDCCAWEGVTCDKITGHVIMLDLEGNRLIGKMVDSSLLELRYLSHLDLSFNNFQLSPIPAFLGSMKQLHHLDLSDANFSRVVPHSLGNLSSLRVLRLGGLGNLEVDDLTWVSNLSSLEFLDLSSTNLSQIKDLAKVLRMLPSLTTLYLDGNGIDDTNIPLHDCVNSFPLPNNIQNLSLAFNSFHGEFPCFFQNMTSLKVLDLSGNAFSGPIPASLGKLPALIGLYLVHSNLSGPIPSSLGNLTTLRELFLYGNQLSGHIPISLGQLSNIELIDISSNSLDGTISEAHFAKLSKLTYFRIGSNMLNFVVESDWVSLFQLQHLSLNSIKIGGQFPHWLQSQKNLTYLDLSDSGISGNLPKWFYCFNLVYLFLYGNHITGSMPYSLCEMKELQVLDLSENHLSGNLPHCLANLRELRALILSSNELSGIIPNTVGEVYKLQWLQLNNNSLVGQLPQTLKNCTDLIFLDVGDNKLSGKLPEWIGLYFGLRFLKLRNNEFHGIMSPTFCQLSNIQIMDLANNKLTGRILNCLGNLSNSTSYGWEIFSSTGSLGLVIKGMELKYGYRALSLVFHLDLSNNNIVGEIPSELTNFSTLVSLNLSHNHLGGTIPTRIGDLKSLLSLDLSNNNLSGIIPGSLSNLNFLSRLNLSNNNLSGKIPTGNQLQTLDDPSIYEGNPGLCGPPLLKKCPDEGSSKSPNTENKGEANEGDRAANIYFYGVVASGFATGFWGLIGVLVFKRSWRQAYFNFLELAMSKMLGL